MKKENGFELLLLVPLYHKQVSGLEFCYRCSRRCDLKNCDVRRVLTCFDMLNIVLPRLDSTMLLIFGVSLDRNISFKTALNLGSLCR